MKYAYQTSRIVDEAIKQSPKGRFLFLTLTVKNVEGEALNSTISQLTKSFDRLFKRAKVQRNLLGYLRSVEVTHNENDKTYHPHIHVLMMVRPSYFQSKKIISLKKSGVICGRSRSRYLTRLWSIFEQSKRLAKDCEGQFWKLRNIQRNRLSST